MMDFWISEKLQNFLSADERYWCECAEKQCFTTSKTKRLVFGRDWRLRRLNKKQSPPGDLDLYSRTATDFEIWGGVWGKICTEKNVENFENNDFSAII